MKIGTIVVLLILLVTACGGSNQPEISSRCLDAMERAAQETDVENADPLIIDTLDACESPTEWLAALREHPAAMGLKDSRFVSDVDLEVACDGNERTRVCSAR